MPDLRTRFLLVALCGLLYLPGAHRRDFWGSDEPRYAAIVERMVVTGEWLIPHLNGAIYSDKPPLFLWLLALLRAGWGHSPTWLFTLPAALCAVLCVLQVESAGRRWLGGRAGVLSALVLATSGLWLGLAQAVRMDIPFALAVSAALVSFLDFWLGREAAPERRLGVGFWFAIALAVLIKGPVGVVVPLLVVLAFLAVRRDGASLAAMRPLVGLAVVLAVVGLWLVPALIVGGPSYAEAIFLKQTLGRAVRAWTHRQPFWFHLVRLPLVWFPWFPLLVAAVLAPRRHSPRSDGVRMFLLCWAGVWIGFFSCLSGKLEVYLLPVFPALALLVGNFVSESTAADGPGRPAGRRRALLVALGITSLVTSCLGVLLLTGRLGDASYLQGQAAPALFLSAGVAGLAAALMARAWLAFQVVLGFQVAVVLLAVVVLVPVVDPTLSGRALAEQVHALGGDATQVRLHRIARPEYSWWLQGEVRTTQTGAEMADFLSQSPRALGIARRDDFERLRVELGPVFARQAEVRLNRDQLILFRKGEDR